MKKTNLLILALAGCTFKPSVDVSLKELKYNEVMGYNYSDLEGRLFSISCKSSGNSDIVDSKCLENASEVAFRRGYQYFTVKNKKNETVEKQRTVTKSHPVTINGKTTYIPTTDTYIETVYTNSFDFTLIGEDEIKSYDNYYIVDDYFPPRENRIDVK